MSYPRFMKRDGTGPRKWRRTYGLADSTIARIGVRKELKTVKKKIHRMQAKRELLHHDTSLSFPVTSSATFNLLNGIGQGDTTVLRTGNDINITSVRLKYDIGADAGKIGPSFYRIILLWDQQANGGLPTVNEVLDVGVISSYILAPYSRENQKRFKIIYDRVKVLEPKASSQTNGTTDSTIPPAHVGYIKRSFNRTVKYKGNGNTSADIATNSLLVLFISDLSADYPSVTVGTRVYFTDD